MFNYVLLELKYFFIYLLVGTYKDAITPKGLVISDHMLMGSVVATILVIVVTAQVFLYLLSLVVEILMSPFIRNILNYALWP